MSYAKNSDRDAVYNVNWVVPPAWYIPQKWWGLVPPSKVAPPLHLRKALHAMRIEKAKKER